VVDQLVSNGFFLGEGEDATEPNELNFITPIKILTGINYLQYNRSGPSAHEEILKEIAVQAAGELQEWVDWLNQVAASDSVRFTLVFNDTSVFNASIKNISAFGSEWREFAIIINLGCLPFLLGAGNRLAGMLRQRDQLPEVEQFLDRYQGWDPAMDPVGMLTLEPGEFNLHKTTRIVLDALILILLHEATHGCRGHLSLPKIFREAFIYRRALESEADWGAGYLFIRGMASGVGSSNFSPNNLNFRLVGRLVHAATCNYLGFQSQLTPSAAGTSLYYLPHTRSDCTYDGAQLAWLEATNMKTDISGSINTTLLEFLYVEMVFSNLYPGWISHADDRSKNDKEHHRRYTNYILYKLVAQLAPKSAAPLKGKLRQMHSSEWDALMLPKRLQILDKQTLRLPFTRETEAALDAEATVWPVQR
jgi:hypothetical protein